MFAKVTKSRPLVLLPMLFAAVISMLILLADSNTVSASHSSGVHSIFMHSSSHHEMVCVDAQNSSMSQSTLLSRVKNTLRYGNPGSDWHGLAGNRIYFLFEGTRCSWLNSSQLSSMRVRVYAYDNNASNCFNNSNASCVKHYNWSGWHSGGNDYAYQKVFLKTSHVNGTAFYYHHTIGHEFGHVLGLNDPGNCASTSIMHSAYYGCTDREWPTSSDRTSVTNIANSYNPPWYP